MGYGVYYLAIFFAAYAAENPAPFGLAVLIWLLRGYLPDPVVWLRTMGQVRKLRAQIAMNPANMVATRDLARLYLERRRPKKAITLIEQTRERMAESVRHPLGGTDDAELLFALGVAKFRAGDAEGALSPLVSSVAITPEVGRGDPYMVAGDALLSLGRFEEAEDAYERFLAQNQSSVKAHVQVARARSRRKDTEGAREAMREARQTWTGLPGFKRRKEWGWYAVALSAPLWL